jgi:hypothetical protein
MKSKTPPAIASWGSESISLIGRCLRAAVEGPFFPEVEFGTLFGISRLELAALATSWPDADWHSPRVRLAVLNSLNNLTGYPHREEEAWQELIGSPREEVVEALTDWITWMKATPS